MTDTLALRLRLALGGAAELGDELPALGGIRVFAGRARGEPPGTVSRTIILHAPPPDGPLPTAMARRADLALALVHPNVSAPVATGDFEGRAWVVEPVPAGVSLRERLRRGPLTAHDTIAMLRDITRGIAAMHRKGLAHGALDAGQVYLHADGAVVAGVGRQDGAAMAGDLAAIGALAWTALAGQGPDGMQRSIRSTGRAVSREVDQLVQRLLDAERRPARAELLLAELDAFTAPQASPLTALVEGAAHGGRAVTRHPAGLLLVLMALAALGFVISRR